MYLYTQTSSTSSLIWVLVFGYDARLHMQRSVILTVKLVYQTALINKFVIIADLLHVIVLHK